MCLVWVFPPDLKIRTKHNMWYFRRNVASDRFFFSLHYAVNVFFFLKIFK